MRAPNMRTFVSKWGTVKTEIRKTMGYLGFHGKLFYKLHNAETTNRHFIYIMENEENSIVETPTHALLVLLANFM